MKFMELLEAAGGGESVGKLADAVGLRSSDTSKLVEALGPALMRGLQKNTASDDGVAGLRRALETGGHARYVEDPSLMEADATRMDGNKILGHVLGSKDVSRNVAAAAANDTGIDADLIKKALPLVAALAMGAMSKKTSGGRAIEPDVRRGGLGSLGDLIGGLAGSKSGLDDILGMARKFF